jgi:subtilisin family serine protease
MIAPVALGSAGSSAIQKLTAGVVDSLRGATTSRIDTIIQTTDNAQVMSKIAELGGQVSQVYKSVEALAASIPANKILELASTPSIIRIFQDTLKEIRYNGAITDNLKLTFPLDPVTNEPTLTTEYAETDVESLAIEQIQSTSPGIYTNAYLTNADDIWAETNYGAGSLVVIIDTGVWSTSPLLAGNVIGGVDLSPDVGTPYEGYNLATNHYHGTACAHLMAAHALLRFSPTHPWGNAIYRYDPEGSWKDASGYTYVTCMGIAPAASIYGIKVFPHTGAGVPSSTIMQGIDYAIQMKVTGTADVDVISMSLGGGVGADGEDPEDLLVDSATAAGITVVTAAGNEGPAPLKVGSPGSAKTAIAVGAAMDPIHERVFGDIAYGMAWFGEYYYYPHDEKSIVDFSSRGPAADGRVKPEVVATGSWCFLGPLNDGYIHLGGGTSFSCPQVAGEAALLNDYIETNGLAMGPAQIKQAIYDGADPIAGFTAMEQGAGYVNAVNSLDVIKSASFGTIPSTWSHHSDSFWFPPIDTICLDHGKKTLKGITLEPGKYKYYAFWVNNAVESVKVSLSDVVLADPAEQNLAFGDAGVIYASTSERGGIDAYMFYGLYFTGDGQLLYTSDAPFEPGLVRLVLAGDFSSYNSVFVGNLTIEVTETWVSSVDKQVIAYNFGVPKEAQVKVYQGQIETYYGTVKTGEEDVYTFNIPDANGFAYVFLYWYRDWAHWATSDLDMLIINPDSTLNVDGATAASPEVATLNATLSGTGTYTILIDGYQVYFDKKECYYLEIIYFANPTPLWSSATFNLGCYSRIKSPVTGLAVVWLHDLDFDTWFIGGFAQLKQKGRNCKYC